MIADELVVIGRGRIVAQGSQRDLLAESPRKPEPSCSSCGPQAAAWKTCSCN